MSVIHFSTPTDRQKSKDNYIKVWGMKGKITKDKNEWENRIRLMGIKVKAFVIFFGQAM